VPTLDALFLPLDIHQFTVSGDDDLILALCLDSGCYQLP
jgi:hypothetical protein